MVCAQESRDFLSEFLILFAVAGCLKRRRGRANNKVACYTTENVQKDSSVHADGVYDYDEECLRRKKS